LPLFFPKSGISFKGVSLLQKTYIKKFSKKTVKNAMLPDLEFGSLQVQKPNSRSATLNLLKTF